MGFNDVYNQILLERNLNEEVYWSTNMSAFANIAKDGYFILTPAVGSDKIKGKDYRYYLCVSRVPENSFRNKSRSGVTLVLDGRMLSARYKTDPINYWHYPEFKGNIRGSSGNEAEERIYSDKPKLYTNDGKIIKEAHFVWSDYENHTGNIYEISKLKHTDIFVYDDVKAFAYLNKRKALLLDDYLKENNIKLITDKEVGNNYARNVDKLYDIVVDLEKGLPLGDTKKTYISNYEIEDRKKEIRDLIDMARFGKTEKTIETFEKYFNLLKKYNVSDSDELIDKILSEKNK